MNDDTGKTILVVVRSFTRMNILSIVVPDLIAQEGVLSFTAIDPSDGNQLWTKEVVQNSTGTNLYDCSLTTAC